MGKLIKILITGIAMLSVLGCQNRLQGGGELSETDQEYILSKTNNYQGLIKLYREKLSHSENRATRYKLSEYYYQIEDYESSLHYLQPLIESRPSEQEYLLQSKNLMDLGRYEQARTAVNHCLQSNVKNGEAYNILGVIQAQSGEFSAAQNSFDKARTLFVADDIVINNMAMLAILQSDYQKAFDYLIPLYMRGYDSPGILHNLVYVLVKLQDYEGADSIIRNKNLSTEPEKLIAELARTNPAVKKKDSFTLAEASAAAAIPEKPSQLAQKNSAAAEKTAEAKAKPAAADLSLQAQNPPAIIAVPQVASRSLTAETVRRQAEPRLALVQPPPIVANAPRSGKKARVQPVDSAPTPAVLTTAQDFRGMPPVGRSEPIIGVRFGTHQRFSRLTLESDKPIHFRKLESENNTRHLVEIYNVNINDKLENLKSQIGLSQRDIKQISFNQTGTDTLQMEIELRRPMTVKVFSLPSQGKYKERFVLDVI